MMEKSMLRTRDVVITMAVGIVVCVTARAWAEDWPEFRGPTGQGLASGRLPTEWGPAKNVVWKQPIPGRGWSVPVVARGRVHVTTAVPADDGSKDICLRTLCLEAKSGRV